MITDSEKFKLNLITDLRNPISCISRIRRCMKGPSFLWFWDNKTIIVSELNLKLTFDFDNNISYVEYSDEELNNNDNIFDISQEVSAKNRLFLLESTFFFQTKICFELDKHRLDIENNRLVFRFIESVPDYTFNFNSMEGVSKNIVGEKLPIYNCLYRENLENTKNVYCLAYFYEAQKADLKKMEWSDKATQSQLKYISQIKERVCMPNTEGMFWHHYLVGKFLKIGNFEE